MMKRWQLQEAKNRLSEVVEKAINTGPQTITRHGEDVVIVVAAAEYQKLTSPKSSLLEFFRNSPFRDIELDIKRSRDLGRKIKL